MLMVTVIHRLNTEPAWHEAAQTAQQAALCLRRGAGRLVGRRARPGCGPVMCGPVIEAETARTAPNSATTPGLHGAGDMVSAYWTRSCAASWAR